MILKMLGEIEVTSAVAQFDKSKEIMLFHPWIQDNFLCFATKQFGVLRFEFLKIDPQSPADKTFMPFEYQLDGYLTVEQSDRGSTPGFYVFKPTQELIQIMKSFTQSLRP